jgi:hypothetical protein
LVLATIRKLSEFCERERKKGEVEGDKERRNERKKILKT